ncbi:uncharacterized protein G2W53_001597 [Senna tora]|uniref:Uncharacterized protein n=1 Tax=Senna tora TaxID=362788 RepID=A0A834XGK3_9FABA|nr:uncharacterized protein G2W53_001597 [Senna tora]
MNEDLTHSKLVCELPRSFKEETVEYIQDGDPARQRRLSLSVAKSANAWMTNDDVNGQRVDDDGVRPE